MAATQPTPLYSTGSFADRWIIIGRPEQYSTCCVSAIPSLGTTAPIVDLFWVCVVDQKCWSPFEEDAFSHLGGLLYLRQTTKLLLAKALGYTAHRVCFFPWMQPCTCAMLNIMTCYGVRLVPYLTFAVCTPDHPLSWVKAVTKLTEPLHSCCTLTKSLFVCVLSVK